jgi:hypothetical protein
MLKNLVAVFFLALALAGCASTGNSTATMGGPGSRQSMYVQLGEMYARAGG